MKSLNAELKARLSAAQTTLCFCLAIDTSLGAIGLTDHSHAVQFSDIVFQAVPGMNLSHFEAQTGLMSFSFDLTAGFTGLTDLRERLRQGSFKAARFTVWLVDWQNPADHIALTSGVLGDVQITETLFQMSVQSPSQQADLEGGELYQKHCRAQLGDRQCGVDLSQPTFRYAARVQSMTESLVMIDPVSAPAGWFRQGTLHIDDHKFAIREDVSDGDRRMIRSWAALPPLSPGAAIELTIGCDFRLSSCRERFGNAVNFRGFPYLPDEKMVMRVIK